MNFDNKLLQHWLESLPSEANFWKEWFDSEGLKWKDDFSNRTNPNWNSDQYFITSLEIVNPTKSNLASLLDVGAGPFSRVGNSSEIFSLHPTDPLADVYKAFGDCKDINLPSQPSFGLAEFLMLDYEPCSFDYVTCINALDHSLIPVEAILQMLAVVKKGGKVFLSHVINEGERESYKGLHQWNFSLNRQGNFTIWNSTSSVQMKDLYNDFAIEKASINLHTIEVILEKKTDFDYSAAKKQAWEFAKEIIRTTILYFSQIKH